MDISLWGLFASVYFIHNNHGTVFTYINTSYSVVGRKGRRDSGVGESDLICCAVEAVLFAVAQDYFRYFRTAFTATACRHLIMSSHNIMAIHLYNCHSRLHDMIVFTCAHAKHAEKNRTSTCTVLHAPQCGDRTTRVF